MTQQKWFERKFEFNSSQNIFPSILERLSGTPARLEEKFKFIPPPITETRVDDTWSIKENLGHLTDLESLWQGRVEDILLGREEMRPTDLLNTRTSEANHNSTLIEKLLIDFRAARSNTIEMIQDFDTDMIFKSSLHPRLKTPMRTMDLFLFVAEHDDHHLSRITELVKLLSGKK